MIVKLIIYYSFAFLSSDKKINVGYHKIKYIQASSCTLKDRLARDFMFILKKKRKKKQKQKQKKKKQKKTRNALRERPFDCIGIELREMFTCLVLRSIRFAL